MPEIEQEHMEWPRWRSVMTMLRGVRSTKHNLLRCVVLAVLSFVKEGREDDEGKVFRYV
jgi:hypothetical protein